MSRRPEMKDSPFSRGRRERVLCIMAALILTAALFCSCGAEGGKSCDVWFFNVGKADAILLDLAGKYVMIDCGEKDTGKELVKALKEKGINRLEYLIITHFDKDHVGGAARVLEELTVGCVLQNAREKDSDEYDDYVDAVKKSGVATVTVRERYDFETGGASFSVIPGAGGYDKDKSNNYSLVTAANIGGVSFLFAGDIQTERIDELLADGAVHADILKVPYHGKEEERFTELLAAVSPEVAVITSSDKEPESESSMEALKAAGVTTYLTREGTVRISVKDGTYSVGR